jgi:hypothetical protein
VTNGERGQDTVLINENDYLSHYGILRKSGRYPWGSGETQTIRNKDFLDYVNDLKRDGLTEAEIARGMGVSTTDLRGAKSIAKNEQKQADIAMAQRLKDKGYSNVAIGQRMNKPESTVRALLSPGAKDKADVLETTANMLKDQVAEKKYVDIGTGVENYLSVSKERLSTAVGMLREEGYEVHGVKVTQLGTGHETELKILAPPGTTQKEVWQNRDQIKQITNFSEDGGRSFYGLHDPIAISQERLLIRYGKEGGDQADGVIYVRPGVEDISLGQSRYAQVRIAIGDGHYVKGMAMYKDDLPNGVDLIFNTNKNDTGNKTDALKPLSDDKDNPFGAIVRQIVSDPGGPNERVTSAMNIVNEEADWSSWSKSIASQVLSKQSPALAKTQLNMTYESRKKEYGELSSLTNPTVRKKLLEDFADGTDSAAVHLQAAALPNTGWYAILPINSLPPNQIYAPNYLNGERVALIRYPHGGTFEIPELTVNNNHPEARKLLSSAKAAVGIHHSVAARLSGADFDGDTVLVIPNNSGRIKATPALEALKDFDPRSSYPGYEGMKKMDARTKQQEMGQVSNLITDMTIHRASPTKIAQAVRHSMVVIDAENHGLNWKQSAIDNGIAQLKKEYQGSTTGGASTLISRAGAKVYVPERKARLQREGGPIDPNTGKRVFVETRRTRTTSTGDVVPRLQRSKRLAETDDAGTLSSGTVMEQLYVEHSNSLKAMANQARLQALNTPPTKYSPSAKKAYSKEVTTLNSKLALAQRNRPLERQAQLIANTVIKAKRDDNPNMDDATYKKIKFQALQEARNRTGAKKQRIQITPSEWDAIQAGAISDSKLNQILDNADMDVVRDLATPRDVKLMTPAKTNRAASMLASGYTRAEVASALGVSLTTLDKATE